MSLGEYIDLYALLKCDRSTRKERRAFGLKHEAMKQRPVRQLGAWVHKHRHTLSSPLLSERIEETLYGVTLIVVIIAFIVGIFSGVGLLSYSGKAPVNLVYFLAMVVFLSLVTMSLSLIAMIRADRSRNLLVHISPAFWMQKLLALFGSKAQIDDLILNPKLLNWMIIRRSQMMALAFSVGLLAALLGVVITRDVAFAWSTTLDISAESFWHFTQMLALPWRDWLPQAVPSLDLVSRSHYYRLGGHLQESMVVQAALLGTWWKFLAMATLFYAVLLRVLFYLLATWGYKSALHEAMLGLDGAQGLLRDMNEPLVTTQATQREGTFHTEDMTYACTIESVKGTYDMIQGWAIDTDDLAVLADMMKVSAPSMHEAGGNHTLKEDRALIANSHGHILLFVKAWEPPTMDFVDYLQMLSDAVSKVVVVPVGTQQEGFVPDPKAHKVWLRKIAALEKENVWVR